MFERFKGELVTRLVEKFNEEDINKIISELSIVANNYDISLKECSLVVYGGVPEIVKTFLACKKIEGYSDGTLNNYKTLLVNFFTTVNKNIEEIIANDVRAYLYLYKESRQISNRTLNKYQDNLKAFFAWAYDEGYIQKNITKQLGTIKYEIKERQALSQIELEHVRNACDDLRSRAMVEFIYSTGCRVSELCGVKKSDINWGTKTVLLFGKGSKYRTSFLNAKAEFYLKWYMSTRHDDNEYLFVSKRKPHNKLNKCGVEKIFRDLNKKVKLDKHLTPHILRHTTATTALHNGMSLDKIQKILGHSTVSTTMIYAKTNMEDVKVDHRKYII